MATPAAGSGYKVGLSRSKYFNISDLYGNNRKQSLNGAAWYIGLQMDEIEYRFPAGGWRELKQDRDLIG